MNKLFENLLRSDEIRKTDFKRDQYRLDNESLKSKFVKDILCMANAPGGDGYIVLGVKSEKGKPREVIGISGHHDSADLAGIVNGVVEAPIQFEYHTIKYKGRDCAIIHVPSSIGRPHWTKRDFGILKKHVFYTRRASGNTEASIEEIRQMCMQTIRISDVAKQKARIGGHVVDELATLNLEERKSRMYQMLRSISREVGLSNYRLMVTKRYAREVTEGALVGRYTNKTKHEFVVCMYPWSVNTYDIKVTRRRLHDFTEVPLTDSRNKLLRREKERLRASTLIHVAYKGIRTSGVQDRAYDVYIFANEINEDWGRIVKWQNYFLKNEKCEFFMANVSSREELKDRLVQLLEWVETNMKDE